MNTLTVDYSVKPDVFAYAIEEHPNRSSTVTFDMTRVRRLFPRKKNEPSKTEGEIVTFLDARFLEELLKCSELISDDWNDTYFWGTVVRNVDEGTRYVLRLYKRKGKWQKEWQYFFEEWPAPVACLLTPWQSVEGRVIEGHRLASGIDESSPFGAGTIELQMSQFKEQGLDLGDCFRGTLNVSIHPKIREVLLTVPRFKNIKWHKDYPPENFFFSACRVTFRKKTYAGWVYYPDPSTKIDHFQSTSLFEIIAETIPNIVYGDEVSLEINPDEIRINPE